MTLAAAGAEAGAAQAIASALQLAIGGAFALSLLPKLRRPRWFAVTVARYELIPVRAASAAAALVMAGEAVVAITLLTGRGLAAGVALGLLLLAVFAVATAVNLRRGRDIECGCFGSATETISPRSLARIGAFAAGAVALAALTGSAGAEALRAPWTGQPWADAAYLVEVAGLAAGLAILTVWALENRILREALARSTRPAPPAAPVDSLNIELRGLDG